MLFLTEESNRRHEKSSTEHCLARVLAAEADGTFLNLTGGDHVATWLVPQDAKPQYWFVFAATQSCDFAVDLG
jgi:hypothetical protein